LENFNKWVSRNKHPDSRLAAAVLVNCTRRKTVRPSEEMRAVSLPICSQRDLETVWLDRVNKLAGVRPAGALYSSHGFRLAQRAARIARAPVYVVSAGLGLVAADCVIPSYGITIGGRGDDLVSARAAGGFDPSDWWSAVSQGRFATPLVQALSDSPRRPVLVGLTRPYAVMLASALSELPEQDVARLRIIGLRLNELLPPHLQASTLPYDERLDAVLPGTRSDFAQRAVLHFVTQGLSVFPHADATDHRDWVTATLADQKAPPRPKRARHSDQGIMTVVERHLHSTQGIGRLLRVLREVEGIACEQARFARLYRTVISRRTAG